MISEIKKYTLLSVILSTIMLSGCTKKTSNSFQYYTYGDFEYYIEEGVGLAIMEYLGNDADVVIPDYIDGQPVYKIAKCTNYSNIEKKVNDTLETVYIPDTVTNIGSSAFGDCVNLKEVTGGENIEIIGNWAFSGCINLESITIADSVRSIGEYAFRNCESLSEIIIPEATEEIFYGAFYNCTNLKNVEIPSDIKRIGSFAFYGTKWFNELKANTVVGDGILIKGETYNTYNNEDIWIPEGVKIMCDFSNDEDHLSNIYIPDSVEYIGYNHFDNMSGTDIYIPSSVKLIGYWEYDEDDTMNMRWDEVGENITFIVEKDSYAQQYATDHNIEYRTVDDVQAVYESTQAKSQETAKYGSDTVQEYGGFEYYTVDDGTVEIVRYTGEGKEVTFPEEIDGKAVKTIGDGINSVCLYDTLEEITVPDSVTCVGSGAFWGTKWFDSLKGNVVVGDGILIRREYCYDYGNSSVWIPQGVRVMMRDDTNDEMTENIYIPDTVESIEKGYFSNIIYANIYIPPSVTDMGEYDENEIAGSFGEGLCLMVETGSYAFRFAIDNGIEYVTVDDVQAVYEGTLP